MTNQHQGRIPEGGDDLRYQRFTFPGRLDKALHTLEGLLRGIAADGVITVEEVNSVRNWMAENADVAGRHPFNEVMALLNTVLADGVLDEDEIQDVLWLCKKLTTDNAYYATVTSDIQRLQGVLAGIASDGFVTEEELRSLQTWMDEHDHLKGCWPYDELESLIVGVLEDGRIDPQEHEQILAFFLEFLKFGEHRALEASDAEADVAISGLCAVCPEIVFEDRTFCFTGSSKRASRSELASIVERCGGRFSKQLTKKVDFLIIGADGNPAWAYACYGRKVEQAVQHRKQGGTVQLIHENDFWDAVEDAEAD